jgi:hypothetical protein
VERVVAHELPAMVERQPDVPESRHRAALEVLILGQRRRAAEQAEVEREAARAGTTVAAIRQAKAEERQRRQRMRDERDLARARKAVRRQGGPPRGGDDVSVARIEAMVAELWVNDQPTQEAVADALGCTPRWLSEQARPDGGWAALVARVRQRR